MTVCCSPGLLHHLCNFLTVAALHLSLPLYPDSSSSIHAHGFPSLSVCKALIHALLPLPTFSHFFLSFHVSRSSPPPPRLSAPVLPWVMEHAVPSFRLYEPLLALPFHAVCVCAQDCSCFFLWGGMSVLNHMISPNDKPSLCNPATWRQGSYVGWWQGTWRTMVMHKILFVSSLIVCFLGWVWRGAEEQTHTDGLVT